MKELENDVNQLEEEASSLVDQVIALKAELIKKTQIITELHSWSKKLEEDQVKKDKIIADLHSLLVASK